MQGGWLRHPLLNVSRQHNLPNLVYRRIQIHDCMAVRWVAGGHDAFMRGGKLRLVAVGVLDVLSTPDQAVAAGVGGVRGCISGLSMIG